MLTYIVNALYKTGRTEESLQYAEKLKEGMEEYNQLLFDKYYFFYYNSLVINYSRKNIEKAIAILEKLKTDEKIRNFSFYKVFIYTNLALLLFIRQDYYNAFQHINRLYLLTEYETVDASVKMKIALAELIIRYELGDYDVLRRRLKQVGKDYEEFLQTKEFARESIFLNVLNSMNESVDPKHDPKVQESVKSFGQRFPTESGVEEELIDYNEWVAGKVR
ncbi:MAG: hypothetical protein WD077_02690 [Bacteroidia bacterium]